MGSFQTDAENREADEKHDRYLIDEFLPRVEAENEMMFEAIKAARHALGETSAAYAILNEVYLQMRAK